MSQQDHYYGVIMAGGRGTRFWPRSRRQSAKQVLRFFGERSLIQDTVDRLAPMLPPDRIWIITSGDLRNQIVEQLPEVPPEQIIAEPAPCNTAPCIALAAQILNGLDKDAVMGVFPADHVITKPDRYLRLLAPAFEAAAEGKLVVLGIKPRWAETGYGYIEFPSQVVPGDGAVYAVESFREKPDDATAQQYLQAGNYFWNAGMFFWRTDAFLSELRTYLPHTAATLAGLPAFRDPQFLPHLQEMFPRCDKISVDFAIMEKSTRVAGIAADDIGWNDVGSWNAVYEMLAEHHSDVHRTEVVARDSARNYVEAPGKLTALIGVHDLVIVDTPDALLICRRDLAQDVGAIVKALEQEERRHLL